MGLELLGSLLEMPLGSPLGRILGLIDTVGSTVGMWVGFREGESVGEWLGRGVGRRDGEKVVEQTPVHGELSQIHISVNVQLLQQEIQLHLLLSNISDPREETEFGKVTPREKPEQPPNAT